MFITTCQGFKAEAAGNIFQALKATLWTELFEGS